MSFAELKKNRKSQFDKLADAAKKVSSTQSSSGDDRFWKPTVDSAGNGSAILRFLPPPEGEDVPFVRYWSHGFKGPGGWYIENSLTSLGQDDPVGEYNSRLWNEIGTDAAKDQVRKQKRRLHYVSNVYVISDPANPDNEGKVFLYQYGKKIFDMINDAMHPEFDDEEPINPFDLWEGANFRLRARNVEGYRNYDKSSFDSPTALKDDDDELERIWKSCYSLSEFLSPKNFKTYQELTTKLTRVLGMNPNAETSRPEKAPEQEAAWSPPAQEPKKEKESKSSFDSDDDDDSLAYFQSLANE